MYEPRAARLHEELVPITARWSELSQRKQPLKPYAQESELKTLDLLDRSLLPSNLSELDPTILEKLRVAAPQDVEELLGHLTSRAQELATSARAALAKRAEQEAKAMAEILTSQKKRASDLARKHASNQLSARLR